MLRERFATPEEAERVFVHVWRMKSDGPDAGTTFVETTTLAEQCRRFPSYRPLVQERLTDPRDCFFAVLNMRGLSHVEGL